MGPGARPAWSRSSRPCAVTASTSAINLGRPAGGSQADHLHVHCVPALGRRRQLHGRGRRVAGDAGGVARHLDPTSGALAGRRYAAPMTDAGRTRCRPTPDLDRGRVRRRAARGPGPERVRRAAHVPEQQPSADPRSAVPAVRRRLRRAVGDARTTPRPWSTPARCGPASAWSPSACTAWSPGGPSGSRSPTPW